MKRDFTLTKYKELCKAIAKSDYIPLTVEQYLEKEIPEKFIILRHDVDRKIKNVMKIAKIEKNHDVAATYYFRMTKEVFQPELIKEVSKLGHEIGYHYEVLVKAKGNFTQAIELFKEELTKFRNVYEVKTICMHGNPLSPIDNRDLWKKYDFKEFGINGDAYLSIDFNKVVYISDTGRSWNGAMHRIKDVVDANNSHHVMVKSTDDIIELIENEKEKRLYILTHHEKWNDSFSDWLITLISHDIKKPVKIGLKWFRALK